jgi:hypothetical protein
MTATGALSPFRRCGWAENSARGSCLSDGYVEQIGRAYYSISLKCIDDLDPTELAEICRRPQQ